MSRTDLCRCCCGAAPQIAYDATIAPPSDAWAVHCSVYCGADTHWQCDFEKARDLWNADKVRNQRGGQHSDYTEPRAVQ